MLNNLLIFFRFSLVFFFLFPLSLHLLDEKRKDLLHVLLVTVGLSLGLGSYLLFLVYLFNGKLVTQTFSSLLFLLVFLLLFLIFKKEVLVFFKKQVLEFKLFFKKIRLENILRYFFDGPVGMLRLLVIVLLFYAFLLAPFFPISQWDDLVRYAAWGNSIFFRGEIGPHIRSYPILIPLLYTYGFLSSGFRNDYLIKLVPFVFGLLTLGLTYVVANDFFEKRKYRGLLAVFFVLCFVPFFDWLHLGYVDIASSFYFFGAFYFFYLYVKEGKFLSFLGLFLGLSLWAKQQTMIIFASVFLASLLIFISQKKRILDYDFKVSFKKLFPSFLLAFLIFFPWYLRDFLLTGIPVQLPVLESAPTVEAFFPFIHNWESVGYYASAFFQMALFFVLFDLFLPSQKGISFKRKYLWGIAIVLVALSLIPVVLEKHPHFTNALLLNRRISFFLGLFFFVSSFWFPKKIVFKLRGILALIFIWLLPFYFVWWLKYTTVFRYLVTVIPFFVLLFVFVFDRIFQVFKEKFNFSKLTSLFLSVLLVGFVLPRFSNALMGVGLKYFFADVKTKGLRTIDDSYIVGEYLHSLNLPGRPKIVSTDNRLSYFAPGIDFHNVTPAYLSDLLNFDYFILNPWTKEAYDLRKIGELEVYFNLIEENPKVFEKVYEHVPYKVYRIILTNDDFTPSDLRIAKVREEIEKLKDEKIQNIAGAATPAILPGDWQYSFKRARDEFTLFQGKVFYNRPQVITFIASKRLLEAYEICLYRDRCNLSEEPLDRFRNLLGEMRIKISSSERLFIDESFFLSSELEKNFIRWGAILSQMSGKEPRAQEILEKELFQLINDFYQKTYRLEPKFSYYDKKGELILPKEK